MEHLVSKSINAEGKLVISNSTSEDCETLKKIQGISTELNAIEKGIVSREEFNGLREDVNELKNLLVRNQAHLIKAGDVQISLTLLSLKHIIVEGNEYLYKCDYTVALDRYGQAIEIDPNNADAWNNKGIALHNLRKFKEAIDCCDMAIRINPNYADAWNNKGVSLGKLGKYKEAIECTDRAVKIDPNYIKAWNNKGIALHNLRKFKEAIDCCDMAIRINPNYADAWNNKGVSLGKLGKYKEAIECYDMSIDLDPNFARAWINKGNALRVLGEQNESNRCFSRVRVSGLKLFLRIFGSNV
jgi:tetratricopeptide (TPR) repeat protein